MNHTNQEKKNSEDTPSAEVDGDKEDPDFIYSGRWINKRKKLINMESCSDSDRLDNSIRGQQCVANAAARQLGFPDACVSKSTVHRHREKTRLNAYSSSYNEINKQDSL